MLFEMHLSPIPFNKIITGRKNVEMRLLTEERKKIRVGDQIRFTNNVNNKTILVEVTNLTMFKNFKELYNAFPKERLGYNADEPADYHDMEVFYTPENIKKFGVIAIEIKLIS